jgi:hypothetical protein
MDAIDEFPSSFWKAQELSGKRAKLTIAGAAKEVMNDGKPKLVLSFREDTRRLVLNVGNRTELVTRFGRDTEDWVDKQVTLITQRVQGPNGPTLGIRFADAPLEAVIEDEIPAEGGSTYSTAPSKPTAKRSFN